MNNTNIRNEKIETLNDLIAVTRDSAAFYGEAAGKVDNPALQSLFSAMADSKNGLVGAMSRDVKAVGAEATGSGTFRGALHKVYGDVRARLGDDTDYAYVAELEETEDRLLGAWNNVLADGDAPAPVKEAVSSYLPKVQEHHALMRDRKWAMEARH
jgi:uncharacterized protein (TIGR02284 family)